MIKKNKKKYLRQFKQNHLKHEKKSFDALNLPRHVPLFIKFVDKERLARFLRYGELHFGKLSEYRNRALPGVYSTVDTIIGDLDEDTLHKRFGENTQIQIDKRSIILRQGEYVTFREVLHPEAAAFCFTAIPRSSLQSIGNNTFKINKVLIEQLLKNFPISEKVPVMLTDIGYIWEMVRLSAGKTRSVRGPVLYTDNQSMAVTLVRRQMGIKVNSKEMVPFTKKNRYKDQYEYRFLLDNSRQLNKQNNLEIGSLRNHVRVMRKLDDITVHVEIEKRKLTRLEIYRGLQYTSFSVLSLLEFFSECYSGKYIVGMPRVCSQTISIES